MTLIEEAGKGKTSPLIERVAALEKVESEYIREGLVKGEIVVPKNRGRELARPVAIGKGLKTKVNANLGTSTDYPSLQDELEKAETAIEAGADTVMDLSTGGDLDEVRRRILQKCPGPLGTVPIYQAVIETIRDEGALVKLDPERIFEVIERQAEDGVDFMTVHCGVTRGTLERLRLEGRVTDIVSRGGAFLVTWMVANGEENPLYEQFDRLLEIAGKYDVTLSLGDGFRPGCIADATDRAQIYELILLGELAERALEMGVQVMIEGPGHIPFQEVELNVLLEKKLCHNAPFYVLGPLVTDIAPGYDHISLAIGGAAAAAAGADFLCYVTPSEHLALPTVEDVRLGVITSRIAAHAGDIAKGVRGAEDWDLRVSRARKDLDWEEEIRSSIDPMLAKKIREDRKPRVSEVCTMCGDYCAIKLVEETLKKEGRKDWKRKAAKDRGSP